MNLNGGYVMIFLEIKRRVERSKRGNYNWITRKWGGQMKYDGNLIHICVNKARNQYADIEAKNVNITDAYTLGDLLKDFKEIEADYLKLKDDYLKMQSEYLQLFNKMNNNQEILVNKVVKLENSVTTLLSIQTGTNNN